MKITKAISHVVLGTLLVLHTGCAALLIGGGAAAGIGGYAYAKGDLNATHNASMTKVWDATLKAMKELEYPVTVQAKDALEAHVVARNAEDKKIDIKLKELPNDATEIKIRVGTFGDEA